MREAKVDAEQRSAGVGVDLDQLWAAGREVEVEAEKGAEGAPINTRRRRESGQSALAVNLRRHDGLDHLAHALDAAPGEEDRDGREQRRVCLEQARPGGVALKGRTQDRLEPLRVDGDGSAEAVERLR